MLKPVEKPIKFVKNLSTKGKSFPITHVSAVIDDNGESVKSTIDSLKNKASLTKVTWLELKNKRDAGKLIPGSLYRITDYNCTTTQENTKSAGHQFDIVLLALSKNKLAEEGWAMMHENDTYFANSNLSAWKVWYCLDNDTARFAWADDASEESIVINSVTFNRYPEQDADGYYAWKHENSYVFTSTLTLKIGDMAYVSDGEGGYDEEDPIEAVSGFGRGVIYRLIDEFNNDVAYDFKNIQFIRKLTDGVYDPVSGEDGWVYTISTIGEGNIIVDGSTLAVNNVTSWHNKIVCAFELTNNVLLYDNVTDSIIDSASYNNTLLAPAILFCANDLSIESILEEPFRFYINNKKVLTE